MTTHAANVESEFELATRPGLDKLLNQSPNTKITYVDASPHVITTFENFDEEEWLGVTPEHLNPQIITRWSAARDAMQLNQLDKGKKTVVLYAIDKPRVCMKDGHYCVYFLDSIVNMVRGGYNRSGYDNIQTEFFYWSPEMPHLVVKQAHMIKTWFENHPRLQMVLNWPNLDFAKRSTYEIVTRSIIYPEWDMSTYQCLKPTSCVWSEWDYWFFEKHKESRAYHHWTKGIDNIQHRIDKKYLAYNFQGRFEGFVGMINGHFVLDKVD
jgi:hypothetical protein